jgi:hypothetical protein
MEENLYAPPKAAVSDGVSGAHDADLHFFAVSPIKMVVLSVCTFGIYQIYWFYKHWVLIKERSEPLIVPWARALSEFSGATAASNSYAKTNGVSTWSQHWQRDRWLSVGLAHRWPGGYPRRIS